MLTILLNTALAAVTVEGGVVTADGAVLAREAAGAVQLGGEVWVLVGGNVEVWAGGQRSRVLPAPDAVAIWSDGTRVWVTVAEWRAVPAERLTVSSFLGKGIIGMLMKGQTTSSMYHILSVSFILIN